MTDPTQDDLVTAAQTLIHKMYDGPSDDPSPLTRDEVEIVVRAVIALTEALAAIDKGLPEYLIELAKTTMRLTAEADAALIREHDANQAAFKHKRRADAADARAETLEAQIREQAMQYLSDAGQANEAYQSQLEAETALAALDAAPPTDLGDNGVTG